MIIDRIVAGIRDGAVAENLQVDPELTLEKAIQITRLSKMVKSQQPTVRAQHQEQSDTVAVDYVGSREGSLPTKNRSSKPQSFSRPNCQCGRCGKPFHLLHQCPAREAICWKCFKKEHFQYMCRSKSLAMVLANDAIRGPSCIPLSVSGKFHGQLQKGDMSSYENIFVV